MILLGDPSALSLIEMSPSLPQVAPGLNILRSIAYSRVTRPGRLSVTVHGYEVNLRTESKRPVLHDQPGLNRNFY
jgi:hypothetical protein